ncbi:MAG: ABC transporter permease [Wenzhouxiangellaceae bacterium]
MNAIKTVMRRELQAYFSTPVAWVFLVIFLVLTSAITFMLGGYYERGIADLEPFFRFHPWLYLFLVPAIAMRLWAEERKSGTIEFLLTLPITPAQAVFGKFLAAWAFLALALVLTMTMWITVNILGNPDNGAIFTAYLGSWLMAGAYLAIGSCISALTRNQVVAFILAVVACLILLLLGLGAFATFFGLFLPQAFVDGIVSLSLLSHFDAISKGVLDLRDLMYYLLTIGFWLTANLIVVELRKAD